jgi:hypothetical protein
MIKKSSIKHRKPNRSSLILSFAPSMIKLLFRKKRMMRVTAMHLNVMRILSELCALLGLDSLHNIGDLAGVETWCVSETSQSDYQLA